MPDFGGFPSKKIPNKARKKEETKTSNSLFVAWLPGAVQRHGDLQGCCQGPGLALTRQVNALQHTFWLLVEAPTRLTPQLNLAESQLFADLNLGFPKKGTVVAPSQPQFHADPTFRILRVLIPGGGGFRCWCEDAENVLIFTKANLLKQQRSTFGQTQKGKRYPCRICPFTCNHCAKLISEDRHTITQTHANTRRLTQTHT